MKKVLSFVLVLALVLGSFGMVFAAPAATGLSDIADSANAEAIQVVNDLGIVTGYTDGTFQGDKAVNRAEFAAMITRALAIPESALAGYSSTTFKDVAGFGWAVKYLAFCESKGIMLGDGQGNVMPGNTITVNEAMTMTLRAVGYINTSAMLVGTWPGNYVTIAQNEGLYDDVAANATVNRESAAQIIYNALTVNLVQVATDGETNKVGKYDSNNNWIATTLLTAGLNCTVEPAAIIVGDEASVINLMPYIGAYAVTYLNSDDEIVAMGDIKSTFLTGDYDANAKELEVGDVVYKLGTAQAFSAGSPAADASKTFVNAEDQNQVIDLTSDVDGVTMAVEVSGKTIKTVYSMATWDETINAGGYFQFEDGDLDLEDNTLCGVAFAEDDDEIDYKSFQLLGVASLEDIAEDNVVCIYTDSNDEITKVTVGTKVIEDKKVTKVNSAGDKFTIDGTAYKVISGQTAPALGDTGTAYIAYNGKIFKWDKETGTSGNYAIVLGKAAGNSLDDDRIKLLTKAGDEVTYDIDLDTNHATTFGNATAGALVTYALDKDGVVDELNILAFDNPKVGTGKLSKSGTIFNGKSVDADVVIFTVDGTDYDVVSIADVDRDNDITPVNTYTDGKIEVMIINESDAANTDYVYAVVNSISTAVNDDDEDVQFVEGFADGKAFSGYTSKLTTINTTDKAIMTNITTTALVVLDVDTAGEIKAVKEIVAGSANGSAAYFDDGACITGTITDKDGNEIEVGGTLYTIDAGAVVYQYVDAGTSDAEYAAKSISTLKKNDTVYMWQIDEDSEHYDVVIFTR